MPYDRESVLTIGAVQEALTVSRADLLVAAERHRRGFPTSGPNTFDRFFYVGFSDACYGCGRSPPKGTDVPKEARSHFHWNFRFEFAISTPSESHAMILLVSER
jgi:hypothetical protein